MKNTNIRAGLRIIGDEYDIDEITNTLEVLPTNYWKKGETIRNTKNKYEYTCWMYSTNRFETLDIGIITKIIKDIFYEKYEELSKLRIKYRLEISLDFAIVIENMETPAIYFEEEFVEFLNKIGARIDIDMYVN